MDDQKFLYETFNIYYDKGMKSKDAGNLVSAKRNLMLAAETLLKMAKNSTGELRKARMSRSDRLMEIAGSLTEESLQSAVRKHAPELAASPKAKLSSSKHAPAEEEENLTDWHASETPNIHFDDVAGLQEVKDSIRMRIILPMRYPQVYEKFNKKIGGGILLYGPPGTGKTMVAKAIATEVEAKFFSVKCSDVVSKWFGEAEKNIRNLFDTARKEQRAIIFFDEFEALAARRSGEGSNAMSRLVPELLAQMQGFTESNSTLLLLAATNRPWDIDSAMLRPGRFNELIYVSLPDAPAREFMIKKAMANVPKSKEVSIQSLVDLTEGFNGADVVEFCDRAKDGPLFRTIQSANAEEHEITLQDISDTTKKVKSSVSQRDLDEFNKFNLERE